MNFSTVPPWRSSSARSASVVRAEERLDVLRVHRLGLRREADEVAEEDRDDLALSAGHGERLRRGRAILSSRGADQAGVGGAGEGGGRHARRRRRENAAQEGRCALHRALPVPRRAHAELLRQRRRQALLLLRLRQGRRPHLVRPRDREPRLRRRDRVARRALSRAARVRGVEPGRRGCAEAAGAAVRRARAGDGLLRALPLGHCPGRAGARVPRRSAGFAKRSAASSGSASRRQPRRSRARPPRRASRGRSWRPPASPTAVATTTSRAG